MISTHGFFEGKPWHCSPQRTGLLRILKSATLTRRMRALYACLLFCWAALRIPSAFAQGPMPFDSTQRASRTAKADSLPRQGAHALVLVTSEVVDRIRTDQLTTRVGVGQSLLPRSASSLTRMNVGAAGP